MRELDPAVILAARVAAGRSQPAVSVVRAGAPALRTSSSTLSSARKSGCTMTVLSARSSTERSCFASSSPLRVGKQQGRALPVARVRARLGERAGNPHVHPTAPEHLGERSTARRPRLLGRERRSLHPADATDDHHHDDEEHGGEPAHDPEPRPPENAGLHAGAPTRAAGRSDASRSSSSRIRSYCSADPGWSA